MKMEEIKLYLKYFNNDRPWEKKRSRSNKRDQAFYGS
jgi:hypothetical protein